MGINKQKITDCSTYVLCIVLELSVSKNIKLQFLCVPVEAKNKPKTSPIAWLLTTTPNYRDLISCIKSKVEISSTINRTHNLKMIDSWQGIPSASWGWNHTLVSIFRRMLFQTKLPHVVLTMLWLWSSIARVSVISIPIYWWQGLRRIMRVTQFLCCSSR